MASIPVIHMNERAAHDSFEAMAAMLRAERHDPALRSNEYWTALKDTARARFLAAFEVL